jgi:predicted alpha-1,2-mannosidase
MPATGTLEVEPAAFASTFSHATEEASPGYYAVTLDDSGVRAELTATGQTGLHRYTFPAATDARVLIDVGHSRGDSRGGEVTVVGDRTIEGHGVYNVHPLLDLALSDDETITGRSVVYFTASFSKSIASFGTWKRAGSTRVATPDSRSESGMFIGAWAGFPTTQDETIEVRVALSLVSLEQARRNLDVQLGTRSFDDVRAAARAEWNCLLRRARIEGGTSEQRAMYYTALYRTATQPTDFVESDGFFFSGADGHGDTFNWKGRRFLSDDWCAWDTFRTSHPLATIIEPETIDDRVTSYLHLYEQGG